MPACTPDHLAHDRSGPDGGIPIVLVHAGVADRRMWDGILPGLTATRDVVRVDLRGFGESTCLPAGAWSARADLRSTLAGLGITRAHLVGCSYGAGVCTEFALETPELVASLLLVSPAGSLLSARTPDLERFLAAERTALADGDVDAATEANLVHWVDGPHRGSDVVAPPVREAVRTMQRLAFEITLPWPDSLWEAEDELTPPAEERLAELTVPTMVLRGGLDMDAVRQTADEVTTTVPDVCRVDWPDVAHLPSMERPDDFVALALDWVDPDR